MAVPPRLKLTRDQLASFLQDFEQIKQFEKLFATVDTISTVTLDDISLAAGNAGADANDALAQIVALKAVLELLDRAPASATTEQIDDLQDQIAALQQSPPPKEYITPRFGSFYDTTDQTAAVINTAYAITALIASGYGLARTGRMFLIAPRSFGFRATTQKLSLRGIFC